MSYRDWMPSGPIGPRLAEISRWLKGVVVVAGEGQIDLGAGRVYIAIVHDSSGYTPGAAIAVDQNPFHDLSNEVLETAFELMKEEHLKDEDYVKELEEEWKDRWEEILTEGFDGRVWVFDDPYEAARGILSDPWASRFIQIIQEEEKES